MFARTYIIYFTRKVAKVTKALAALGVLLFTACSSDHVIEEIQEIDLNGTDPLKFTTLAVDNDAQQETRANRQPSLTTGFMVSTYKSYARTNQQTVMPNYNVEYKTSGTAWDGTIRPYWDYTQVPDQYEKFWDYSAFPYRFHAIAPYPADPSGFLLSDASLKINAPYYYQTCHNGLVQTQANGTPTTAPAEPHILAQVQRNNDGTDHDLLARDQQVDLNNGSTSLNREVWLPFHHLNSKIRFGFYHTTQWLTDNKTYLEHLVISVISPSFVTEASCYEASGTGHWRINTGNSGFKNLKYATSSPTSPHEIFRFDGGLSVEGNDLRERQTRKTAYFMQCTDGIMQLPQEKVQMIVSFDLMNEDGALYQRFTNVPVRLEIDIDEYQYTFDWQSGYIYTYYLVLGEIEHKLAITFTATLTPWEDVSGSLSTDLEQ